MGIVGTIVDFGNKGDPVVRPNDEGRLTILNKYSIKPEIGDIVKYKIDKHCIGVCFGTMLSFEIDEGSDSRRAVGRVNRKRLYCLVDSFDENLRKILPNFEYKDMHNCLELVKRAYKSRDPMASLHIAVAVHESMIHVGETSDGSLWMNRMEDLMPYVYEIEECIINMSGLEKQIGLEYCNLGVNLYELNGKNQKYNLIIDSD